MKEHPILFSVLMIKAILEGRKTQTRRVVKSPKWSIPSLALIDYGCPYGWIGDRLWCKEAWREYDESDEDKTRRGYEYKADCPDDMDDWRTPLFMPKIASRIMLEITKVRVERVQDITAEDALAEGMNVLVNTANAVPELGILGTCTMGQRDMFRELWNSINEKSPGCSWADNPFVWVIEFRRVES